MVRNLTSFYRSRCQDNDLKGAKMLLQALLNQINVLLAEEVYAAQAQDLHCMEYRQVEVIISPNLY